MIMMSYTPADSMGSPRAPPAVLADDVSENLTTEQEDDREDKAERVACDRCRQRKIKCNRVSPCSQCVKTASQCIYKLEVKEKKQRILVSSAYERRLEHISNKIDELSEMMKQLSREQSVRNSSSAVSPDIQRPLSPPRTVEAQIVPRDHSVVTQSPLPSNEPQGIESTLFDHVVFAARFIQSTVENDPDAGIAAEMASALDGLRSTLSIQKQQNYSIEGSRLFSRSLRSRTNSRDLPIPTLDRILACLRIAHEKSPHQLYWPFEFGSVGDFTTYVIKACSPGPVSEAELIIVHFGLYYLFNECSNSAGEDGMKQHYKGEALTCGSSLEIILSDLSIHIPTNTDSVRALLMATLYCLRHTKPSAAWTFISRATLMIQELGLNNRNIMDLKPPEERQLNLRLFWAIYVLEKAVSLRLGRPSTIRDHDITVPRLHLDRKMASLAYNRLPDWIGIASFYGRVYDDIYSPSALAQPDSIRISRSTALASEFEGMLAVREELYKRPQTWASHAIHPRSYSLMVHANKAANYSTLASMYKAIPSDGAPSSVPHAKCLLAARASLNEAESCMAILASTNINQIQTNSSVDEWITQVICMASLLPFLILFGNIIQPSNQADLNVDLGHLQRVVIGLHSTAQASPSTFTCIKQLRILEALYNVATKYTEAKSRSQSNQLNDPDLDLNFADYLDDTSNWISEMHFPALATMSMSAGLGILGFDRSGLEENGNGNGHAGGTTEN